MSATKFNHSIKVPRFHKIACKVVQKINEGGSLKKLIDQARHPNKRGLAALVIKTLQHQDVTKKLFETTSLLRNESIDETLAAVLTTDLLWGNKSLKGDSKPVETILKYKDLFLKTVSTKDFQILLTQKLNTIWRPRYVRVNTLKSSTEEVIKKFQESSWNLLSTPSDYSSYTDLIRSQLSQSNFIQDIHVKELLAFPFGTILNRETMYNDGTIFLQDKASCMATYALAPESGSTILDMCAAPGMKTTHLAAYMNDYGTIYAVERNRERYELMKKMIYLSGATCIQPLNSDALKVTEEKLSPIDYILLDVPCSGSGMLSRMEYERNHMWSRRLLKLSNLQAKLLRHALTKYSTVKRIVYSTCSINEEENEKVVEEALSYGSPFELVDCSKLFTGWRSRGLEKYACGNKCIRSAPLDDSSNGFFISVFERVDKKSAEKRKADHTLNSKRKKKRQRKST